MWEAACRRSSGRTRRCRDRLRGRGRNSAPLGRSSGLYQAARKCGGSMSFFKSLFGGRKAEEEKPAGPVKSIEHNGFTIHATPYQDGGQYQLCGVIEKVIDG